jgi:hypothetical protein
MGTLQAFEEVAAGKPRGAGHQRNAGYVHGHDLMRPYWAS